MEIKINSGERFCDKTVLSVLKSLSMSSRMIKFLKYSENGIVVNGTRVSVRYILRDGDTLSLGTEDSSSSEHAIPVELEFDIIYENDDLMVVNKPPFMPTHTSHGHYDDTLANALAGYYASKNIPFVFRPVNRLDRNTSGLVLVAKNKLSAAFMTAAMKSHKIQKSYISLLEGQLEEPSVTVESHGMRLGVIDAPLHRTAESIITREVCARDVEDAEDAITHYRILQKNEKCTLVEAFPVTGRTHQLRVHFAHLGHPIIGDELYGTPSPYIARHALHAKTLSFPLPTDRLADDQGEKRIFLEAPLPKDIIELTKIYFENN